MDTVIFIVSRVFVPFVVVVTTSLPFYVVIRLYPVLLDFGNEENWSNLEFSLFYALLCLGSLLAIQACDFLIEPYLTTLVALVAQFVLLIFTVILAKISRTTVLILLNCLGLTLGMLQTIITAFFGDRYDTSVRYSYLTHFHFYLLGNYFAYFLSIVFVPLKNYKRVYADCCYSECHIIPLIFSAICLAGSAAVIVILYPRSYLKPTADTKLTAIYRMEKAFYIFLPLSVFWMLTHLIEKFWIVQGKNMTTTLQDHHLDMVHATILIVCIPIAWLINLKGNELFRMTLGGILIIISVPLSSFFGSFYDPRVLDGLFPINNITEVYICDIYQSTYQNFYQIGNVSFFGTNQRCMGPFLISQTELFNQTYYKSTIGSGFKLNLTPYYPQTGVTTLVLRPLAGGLGTKELSAVPDRNYQSIAKLALLRIFSCVNEKTANGTWTVTGITNTNIQIVNQMSLMFIMELPEGFYTVSYSIKRQLTVLSGSTLYYLRSGGYYIVMINQGIYSASKGDNLMPMVMGIDCRILGFVRSIRYQVFQYFLLSIGKILIITSGLELAHALANVGRKCSLVGVFWGVYNFSNVIYYLLLDLLLDNTWNGIRAIYMVMTVAIVTFYTLYYFVAYDLTDVVKQIDGAEGGAK